MKKIILLLLALLVFVPVLALTSCECDHVWQDATCTAPKTCTECQATEGSALGHTFGEWNTLTEPTCNTEGSKARLCQTCGTLENGTIPVNDNHTPETIPAVEATCVTAGSTAGVKCTHCEKVLTAPQPVAATGIHKYSARWDKTPEGHAHPCLYCDAISTREEHVDLNKDSVCDECSYEGEGMAKYHAVSIKYRNDSGEMIDVATFAIEDGTAMSKKQIADLYALRYMGFGFATWTYEDGTAFDDTAIITAPITIIGDRGELAGEKITWSYDEGTKTLTFTGEGEMFDFANITVVPWNGVVVNNVVIDTKITSIGAYAFYVGGETGKPGAGMKLSSITLHEGITKIGKYAFYGETDITAIDLPASLVEIDDNAFRECSGLTYIDIGIKNLERVGDSAFAQCTAAEYLIFNGAIDGSGYVFDGCKFTRAFFDGNEGQFKEVEIAFGNQQLDICYMFFYADREPSVAGAYWYRDEQNVPQQWCYAIYYVATVKSKIAFAKDYVFVKNPAVTQENVDYRNNLWFEGYQFKGWGTIDPNDNKNVLENYPKFDVGSTVSSNLTYVGIRGNKVGDNATYSLSGGTLSINGTGKMWDFGTVVSAPWNALDDYSRDTVKKVEIAEGITYIGQYAFCNFANLEYIEIGTNVVEINTKAFNGCDKLKYIYYNGNEIQVQNCKGLENLDVPEFTKVYVKEFEDMSKLEQWGVETPDIRYWTDVNIPTGGTTRLTWEYEDGVLTIGGTGVIPDATNPEDTPWAKTFAAICAVDSFNFKPISEAVTKVIVREGITAVGDNAFAGLTSVTDIVLPESINKLSASAFAGTNFIEDENKYSDDGLLIINNILVKVNPSISGNRVLVPTAVTAVAAGAFADCSNVTEIRLPRALSGVTAESFSGLTALQTIFYHATENDWNNGNLKNVVPAAAKVYFFSNNEPVACGYYWGTLTNPAIYGDWIPEVVHAKADCHTIIPLKGKEPTCVKDGKGNDGCKYCGEIFSTAEVTAPATGLHNYVENKKTGETKCTVCGKQCYHIYSNGVCKTCNKECLHEKYESGRCTVCKLKCDHSHYMDGVCMICGTECSHKKYENGVCTTCGKKEEE